MNELLREEADLLFRALEAPASISIRLNPRKPVTLEALPFHNQAEGRVPWCEQGVYLKERPSFTLDPVWHGGGYYVQEASSMFTAQVLKQLLVGGTAATRVLDLCAAPGGKSTLGVSLLPTGALWVANEVIPSRAAVLKENLIKWGDDRIVVTSGDPARFAGLPGAFDVVLVDAPCSGEGMFRKEKRAVEEWSEGTTRLCEERQRRIVAAAWQCIAPGGYLIYSTCTFNPGENERVLEWAAREFGAEPVAIDHAFAGVRPGNSPLPCYRFYPHATRGEGFFIGVLRKREGSRFSPREERLPQVMLPPEIRRLVGETEAYALYVAGETVGIMPRLHAGFVRYLGTRVGVLYKGCEIGAVEKRRMAHAFALWNGLPREEVRVQEVDLATALRYLRREEVRFDTLPGEWVLVTYHSLALGWVKGVGGRVNNYYPKEWRLRMEAKGES
jgi:16S rRNA C967 or C1407 C5-methylase (RsmB/RsmF family)/NOL1/NOP2/fmu family ribosome biogenesis protein